MPERELDNGNYRELHALIKGLDSRVTETRDDAREARDTARALIVATEAQAIPTKLAELTAAVAAVGTASRTDLVNTSSKITTELREGFHIRDQRIDAQDAKIAALEALRHKLEGAGGVFGWLARHMPWLLTVGMTAIAAIGFRDKLP